MFDEECDSKGFEIQKPVLKKKKLENSEVVHSSLDYRTLRVPPIMEYKTIDNYCEKRAGASVAQVTINSLLSVGSPVVFKTPKPVAANETPPGGECAPFCYFSVEELSLVTSLENWSNVEVCPVGKVTYLTDALCHLISEAENGSWRILVDFSLLEENPRPFQLLQVFGFLGIIQGEPIIRAHFVRNIKAENLPLFIESYKYMQKFIPKNVLKSTEASSSEEIKQDKVVAGCEMNDTLNDFSFSTNL